MDPRGTLGTGHASMTWEAVDSSSGSRSVENMDGMEGQQISPWIWRSTLGRGRAGMQDVGSSGRTAWREPGKSMDRMEGG